MKISSSGLLNVILTIMLATSMLFMIVRSASLPPYDPWADIDDDGMIDVKDILHVALLYGATGTPIDKAVLTYDSGWINITDKKGQFFEVTHNLGLAGSTQFTANISGRASLSGQNHQRFFDGTGRRLAWNQTYGGIYYDFGYAVVETGDGGYALAGHTHSYGVGTPTYTNVYLVRTDADGNMLWNQTYGGIDDDFGYALVQTSDGGYTIAGWTRSFGVAAPPYTNVYLVTTDPFGELVGYSDMGLVVTDYTADTIALYRGANDPYWNYIRVYIWVVN